MGIKHANRIEEALRRARADDEDLDAFLDGTASAQARKEPFFVKNLERVQGDERDAIILTIGYGKNADGRMLYRFGPINNEGGERRLNVAITRARARMTVVSSFSASRHGPDQACARGRQDAVPLPRLRRIRRRQPGRRRQGQAGPQPLRARRRSPARAPPASR